MVVRVTCPECGTALKTKDSNVGRVLRCPRCARRMSLSGVFPGPAEPGTEPPTARGQRLSLVSHLTVAFLVAFGVGWFAAMELDDARATSSWLRDRLAAEAASSRSLTREVRSLREQVTAVQVGPVSRFEAALRLDREARYTEAVAAYDEVVALYPGHELAARARSEARRVRRLGWERNMVSLQLSVTAVQVGWTSHVGADGETAEFYPELELRLRNVGTTPFVDGHIRVDFVLASDDTQANGAIGAVGAIGHALARIDAVDGDQALNLTLRSLNAVTGDPEPGSLPAVAAHVWLRRPDTGFLEIGVFPVGREVVSLR